MPSVTYTISSQNYPEFKAGFLASTPVPTDRSGVPLYTEDQWVKEYGRRSFYQAYVSGKNILAERTSAPQDEGIIN